MDKNQDAALDLIMRWEGPEINESPTEPGGISKYGISLTAYADYCKVKKYDAPTMDNIRELTEEQARSWYAFWWLPQIRFDDMPSGVDLRLADISVNLGVRGAINLLEMSLNMFPLTGVLDDSVVSNVNKQDAKALIHALSTGWLAIKHTSPNWVKFGHGWSNRNLAVTAQALDLV